MRARSSVSAPRLRSFSGILQPPDLALLRVRLGELVGLVHQTLDLVLRQAAGRVDLDGLRLVGRDVARRHRDDAVRVDGEGDLDLRHAARRRGDAHQLEAAQRAVLRRDLALALQHVHLDGVLVVDHRGEDLGVLGRNGRVALDQFDEKAAVSLDAQRERGHVEQDEVLDVAADDAALDGGADGDHLVRVDVAIRLAPEDALHRLPDQRRAGLAADQQHLVDLLGLQARLLERVLAGPFRARHQLGHQILEVGARQGARKMTRPALVGGDERQVDRRLERRRELALGALGRLLQALQRHAVAAQIDRRLGAELLDQPVDDALVEVLAAEVGVAGGRAHFEDPLRELQDRDVEGTAAQVVDRDPAIAGAAVESVSERGRGRLVEDAQHLEPGDPAAVLGGLALRVVEVGGHGDDRLADRLAQRLLGERLELAQHERRDLLGAVLAFADLDLHVAVRRLDQRVGQQIARALHVGIAELASDQALDREDRLLRVGDRLALGDLSDQAVAVGGEGDDRGSRPAAVPVGQHAGRESLDHRDAAVGGAEIDADDLAHVVPFAEAAGRQACGRFSGISPGPSPGAPSCGMATRTSAGRRSRSCRR